MQYKSIILVFFCLMAVVVQAQQPDRKQIRIVDTLTQLEKNNRNPVILRSEMDSMMQLRLDSLKLQQQSEPEQEKEKVEASVSPWMIAMLAALLFIIVLLYFLLRNQNRFRKTVVYLNRQVSQLEFAMLAEGSKNKEKDAKSNLQVEKKSVNILAELEKLQQENQRLTALVKEYSQAKEDYEGLKQHIVSVYKIKNYPGYDRAKTESALLKGFLDTERSVAVYAYDHFLKPVIAIVDANKNNPAKISKEDSEKVLQLLLSLSFLYTEYLYLRVNELSVGGKMVERIKGFSNGNGLDLSLLKELNTEHGSRALALRMALDKMNIRHLAYPVFDETNLNLS